jgi:NADPH2:quinone reductase
MKAIRVEEFGGPEVLRWTDVPEPEVSERHVLVELRVAGVNPVETYIRGGLHGAKAKLPYTPGTDGAGVVKEVGSGVDRVRVGDRVFLTGSLTGTYAEFALCEVSQVHLLPDAVSFAQGAALGVPYSTAFQALFHRGRVEAGETVLVHGASGGVGVAAIQLGSAAGARMFGTAGSSAGRALVRRLGAEQVFDHKDPAYLEAIKEAAGGSGVNCILEMLANVNLAEDLRLLAPKGRVVVIGSRGRIEIDPRDTMVRNADIRGMSLPFTPADELAVVHQGLIAGLRDGTIRPVIEREIALAAAAEAHRAVMDRAAGGKIVLNIEGK